ncbi:MAG: Glycine--tRNA ligase 1, mitochondrial [Chaenotheca gracillima]|nr:MAG: Glycine--tRNA ligase 1, mitochondrial [Chaenotheca gracillima]
MYWPRSLVSAASRALTARPKLRGPVIREFAASCTSHEEQQEIPPSIESTDRAASTRQLLDRQTLDALLRRKLFYTPAFEAYGGISGLFDYGPPGCSLQRNIIDLWRRHFVLEEDMLEVDCTQLTPHEVLKTSGHVDKFSDWICKDPETGEAFRADHLVKDALQSRLDAGESAQKAPPNKHEGAAKTRQTKKETKNVELSNFNSESVKELGAVLAQLDNYDGAELGSLIAKYGITNPSTGGKLLPPVPFNLMFETKIGPTGSLAGYLRPETAQGQFLTFQKLLQYNQNALPFAAASVGKCFRNEISPRSGLLRVREFMLAEIEHFVDPEAGKAHPRFDDVRRIELSLLDRGTQASGRSVLRKMTIGDAVKSGLVENEILGYFLARTQMFLKSLGVDDNRLRFRQHMKNEMAHYAADCWDAELLTTYGWIECVGCADRSAYDLSVHAKKTGAALMVQESRPEPLEIEEWLVDIVREKFGPKFRKNARIVEAAIKNMTQEQLQESAVSLENDGRITVTAGPQNYILERDEITIEKRTRIERVREYVPNVIEPSFGIGRILYCLIEHVHWVRDQSSDKRVVLSFPPAVAPNKVLITPLSKNPNFSPIIQRISRRLKDQGIAIQIDESSTSIGKRYSRSDELGTPLGITVDFQSEKDGTVTLRDRDSMMQVRASEEEIMAAIKSLLEGTELWQDVTKRLPFAEAQVVE